MATVTGNVSQINSQSYAALSIKPISVPIVVGGSLVAPEITSVDVDEDGDWSEVLQYGRYELIAGRARVTIDVPNDASTYPFDNLIVSDVNNFGDKRISGSGSPEGVITAIPGKTYHDYTNNVFYSKKTGSGNTGWQEIAAQG